MKINTDWKFLLVLLVVGSLTHLIGLTLPDEVVFDEVHFGKFVTAYCCTHQNFFDIHPPLAKLLIAGTAYLGGYRGGFSFENIAEPYGSINVFALRLIPAIAGILLPLIIYGLLRQLGTTRKTAFFGGALIALDNAWIVQTRLIGLDGVLLVATFGSLSAYLAGVKALGARQYLFDILAGLLAGLAVGTKFTGLAGLALICVLLLTKWLQNITWRVFLDCLRRAVVIIVSALAIYLGGWALHFALLTLPGSGDAFHVTGPIISANPIVTVINFLQETATLHRIMFEANYNLTATHPSMSPWWSWPFMLRPVFYWQGETGNEFIYFLGNPIVWWGSTLFLIIALGDSIATLFSRSRKLLPQFWLPIAGYAIAMLPLVRVPRALFLYHYLTGMIFAWLAAIVWLDKQDWWNKKIKGYMPAVLAGWWRKEAEVRIPVVVTGALLLVLLGFIWFAPLTYGWPVASALQPLIFWLPSWR